MSLTLLRAAIPLLSVPFLMGCGGGQVHLRLVDRTTQGGALMEECAPHPVPPDTVGSDKELALYITDLAAAGENCRIKHACLARWARGEDVAGDTACSKALMP